MVNMYTKAWPCFRHAGLSRLVTRARLRSFRLPCMWSRYATPSARVPMASWSSYMVIYQRTNGDLYNGIYIYIVSPLVYSIIPFIIPYIYQTMLISWDYTYIIIYIYIYSISLMELLLMILDDFLMSRNPKLVRNPMGGHHVGGPDPGGNWQGFKHQTYWWCELTNALPLFTPNIKIWNISPEAIV